MKLLADQLKLSAGENEGIASFAATNVEAAIHQLLPVDKDQKAYLAKAQSLTYNLKLNEVSWLAVLIVAIQCVYT